MSNSTTLEKKEWFVLMIATLIGITCSFGIDMHCPSLPAIVTYFNTTINLGQASVSLYIMSMMIFQLIYGPMSDRLGRKKIILTGLTIAFLGTIICLLSTSITCFLIGRIIQGMGAAVGMSLGRSLLNDVLNKEKMVIYGGYVSMMLSLGLLIAPLIGGYCQTLLGWRGSFYTMGLLFLIDSAIVGLFLRETAHIQQHQGPSLRKMVEGYGYLLTQPIFLIYSLCAGVGLGLTLSYSNMSSFIIQQHYLQTAVVFGWISTIVGVGNFSGKFICSLCVKKLGIQRGVSLGMLCFLIAGALLLSIQYTLGLSILMFVIFIFMGNLGLGFIFSNSVAGALSNYRHIGGTAGALYGAIQNGVGGIVSLIIGYAGFHSILSFSISYVTLSIIGLLLLASLRYYLSLQNKYSKRAPC